MQVFNICLHYISCNLFHRLGNPTCLKADLELGPKKSKALIRDSQSICVLTDELKFKNTFMSNLCNKYLSVKRNEDRDYLEFTIEDIAKLPPPPQRHHSKPKDDDGFDIHGKNNTYLEDRVLTSLVNEGLIEVVSDEMYRLTEEGKKYCKQLD